MSARFLPMLLGLAAALAGLIAWESWPAPQDGPQPGPAAEAARPGLPSEPGPPAAEWVSLLLARPPLSPDRRPPAPPPAAPVAEAAQLPRLTGITVAPQGRAAIFAGQPQPVIMREGGILGRYSVQRIEPGQVTLAGPDGLRVLRPAFDSATPSARPAPAGLAGPGSALPGISGVPGPVPTGGSGLPPIPGTSPTLADAPQDGMPFDRITAPTGADIIRDQARRATGAAPGR